MKFSRNRKMLTTYLYVYSTSDTHYPEYFALGARSTRTACRRPNITQVPKRRDSLRAMFIPSEGRVFIETDYCAAELVSLAQIWYMMFGDSHLRKAINAGEDPHASIARRLFPEEWDGPVGPSAQSMGVRRELQEKKRKEIRQAGKAVNFGLPGGLGARTFSQFSRSYGLDLDLDEAKELRSRAMAAEPCLAAYLSDERSLESRLKLAAKNIGVPFTTLITALNAWRNRETGSFHARAAFKRLRRWARGLDHDRYNLSPRPGFNPAYDLWSSPSRILTGAVRGGCSYTNGRNTPFQGAVAAAAKMACFGIWQTWRPDDKWAPVNFVHDSFLVESEPDAVRYAEDVVESQMVWALEQICPDVRCSVESEIKERWGK
jgi:DNA polymerase I-like protein with 3'-5' exonuclease and polymerase domains